MRSHHRISSTLVAERLETPVSKRVQLRLELAGHPLETIVLHRLLLLLARLVRHARVKELGVQRCLKLLELLQFFSGHQVDFVLLRIRLRLLLELPAPRQRIPDRAEQGGGLVAPPHPLCNRYHVILREQGAVSNPSTALLREALGEERDELPKLCLRHQGRDGGPFQVEGSCLEAASLEKPVQGAVVVSVQDSLDEVLQEPRLRASDSPVVQ